jgi:hypothetical protein
MTTPSTKQIAYLDSLAEDLGYTDAWDYMAARMGSSRSRAQKKSTMRDCSEAIDEAKAELDIPLLSTRIYDGREQIKVLPNKWVLHTDEVRAAVSAKLDWYALLSVARDLKMQGVATPITVAIRQALASATPVAVSE